MSLNSTATEITLTPTQSAALGDVRAFVVMDKVTGFLTGTDEQGPYLYFGLIAQPIDLESDVPLRGDDIKTFLDYFRTPWGFQVEPFSDD